MADSVNSPLLSVVSVDSSSLKSVKSNDSAVKSGEDGGFSRVLDDQKGRDRNATESRDNSAQAASGGKELPADGNRTADTRGEKTDIDSEAARSDSESDSSAVAATEHQSSEASGLSGDLGVDITGDESQSDGALRGSALSDSDLTATRVQDVSFGDIEAAQRALVDERSPGNAVLPLAEDGALTDARLGLAVQKDGAAVVGNVGAAVTPPSAAITPPTATASAAALGIDGQDSDVALAPKLTPAADGLKGVLANGGTAQGDSVAVNRSTADWLRSGMGLENPAQRSVADFQFDAANEVLRAATAQRGDSAAPPLAGSSGTALGLPVSAAPATLAGTVAPGATSPAAVPEYSLSRPPSDIEFPGELTARMKTLVRDGVREARLQLHPAELGRLHVTVSTDGDQARVIFTAETAAAREAIEQSMPRLRDLLEQSGLQLAQSDVGQRDFDGEADAQNNRQLADEATDSPSEADSVALLPSAVSSSRIDTYI